jgi:uncharacterized protein (DUF849 family)/uncharacterized membrane protein YeaQ/YmgE (transglycosylase-associated protein family)
VLGFIITMIIVGAIAGFVARAVVPGRDPMGIVATIVLGIVGSFIGGFLGYLLFHKDASQGALQPAGIIGSIIGAIIALLIYRAVSRRGARVGRRPRRARPSVTPSRRADACSGPVRPRPPGGSSPALGKLSGMWLKACINGAREQREHPAVPVTPEAMAREAAAAVRAGARAVHLHARGRDGGESLLALDLAASVGAVRAAVPGVPVGVSTGLWVCSGDADERADVVATWRHLDGGARPDFASVNLSEDGALDLWHLLADLGIGVEPGVWSPSDLDVLTRGRLDGSLVRVLLEVIGAEAGEEVPRAVELLAAARSTLPAGVPLLLHGEEAAAWPVLEVAVREGLQTRIGLEDTLTGPDGERVEGNADLIRAAQALAASRPGA